MNVTEVGKMGEVSHQAGEAWQALELAQKAFEAANATGSRTLWRESVRWSISRAREFLARLEALLEAEGE